MKKVRKRKMFIAIGVLLVLVGVLMIWFNISYSGDKLLNAPSGSVYGEHWSSVESMTALLSV